MPLIRPSQVEDVAAITRIYAHHVLHNTATFETEAPDEAEMARRRQDVLAKGHPWLVAEVGGKVLGYAYASQFRPRQAFRYTVENSIYLAPEATRQGLGRALLTELLALCESNGMRKMVAVIGDSANAASIGLHAAMGFQSAGTIPACGWKFERWLDLIFMERALGPGATTPPDHS